MIRLKKIRGSARGQECTVNAPMCNYRPETVVGAHYGEPGEKGTALKPNDTSLVYACSDCHDFLDGRVAYPQYDDEREWYWFRAMRRTWAKLIENGVLE